MIKMCKYMYLHLSTIHFYHFVIVTLQTHFFTIHFLTKNYEKARTELSKNAEKKRSQKLKRSDIKYFLTIYFWPKQLKTVQIS